MASLWPDTTKLFFDESKAAREQVDKILDSYRSNTTTVLALATGALTLYGIEDSTKGPWFLAAVMTYGLAAFAAVTVYAPVPWTVNVAHDMVTREKGKLRTNDPIFDMKTSVAQYYLGRGHQIAIRTNLDRLEKWNGPARRFQACALLTALTIVFGALNLWADRNTDSPDPEPTRIVLVDETGS
jgi:hypothetical protein